MSAGEQFEARIVASWRDDPLESPVTIDARVDARDHRIAGKWTIHGATFLDSPRCRPFVLDAAGVMDFGEGRADDERYWRTDLRQRDIRIGAEFRIVWPGGDEGVYVIDRIARLGAKRPG